MRSVWKGTLRFGLVNIPISLYPATRREELKFRLLRKSDLSPVNYKRVAEADGKEVPWEEIVKGYEFEKGQFVVLKDEDFRRVDVEATQSVDIIDFVKLTDINPIYFDKPYYLEPQKGGETAYALLRDTLKNLSMVGISKVVIKSRQHLAAVKPQGNTLILELMHFADELIAPDELHIPKEVGVGKKEVAMAETLVGSMADKWDPQKYTDDYRSALLKLIEEKVEGGGAHAPSGGKRHKGVTTNVIDLVSVLEESLKDARHTSKKAGKAGGRARAGKAPAAAPQRGRRTG